MTTSIQAQDTLKIDKSSARSVGNLAIQLGRRLFSGAVVLLLIIYLSYVGLDMASGVPAETALTQGLRKTALYITRLFSGDLGTTTSGGASMLAVPVTEVVPMVLIRSLGLLAVSLLLASVTGVTLGIWAAGKRSGWSLATMLLTTIGVSLPSFLLALLLQQAVIKLNQASGDVLLSVGGFGWDKHIILPALVLAARPLAQITRITFVSVQDVLAQDYVRTAYSKGLTPRLVMYEHVIRNAAVSILTTIGLSLRFSLSSLPVVEFFFGWPGLGFTLLLAISSRDDDLTIALALCLGAIFIIVNIALDIIYPLIDPRMGGGGTQTSLRERLGLLAWCKNAWETLRAWVALHPIRGWIASRFSTRPPESDDNPYGQILAERETAIDRIEQESGKRQRFWLLSGVVRNIPLLLGGALLLGLLLVFVFAPMLAPHSPYTTLGLVIENGEFKVPPFPPDEIYPWGTDVLGRDMMSLVLTGAQLTILLATMVVLARLFIGFILGALAGWFNGSWIDRLVLGAMEIISSFPALLLAMILILAIGIRNGMQPFVVSLCFVGWGEIAQFVRGEVISLRQRLFIESAVASGARTLRIIFRHILPNLIPALISIVVLDMGAVLMLLGELGFIGIFIGGGAFAELQIDAAPYHYSDVPEWGALLSNVRPYARAYPWTAIYPSLAFFVAILGFNLFGEGLRRLVEQVGVATTRLLVNRYTVALGVLAVLGFVWFRGNTGSLAFYKEQAKTFDAQGALAHVGVLTDPVMDGRALGTAGVDLTAGYIADQFETLGVQPAGEALTYFQTRKRSFEILNAMPSLTVEDGGPAPVYHQDYVEYAGRYRVMGDADGPVRVVAMGNLTVFGTWSRTVPALKGLDYSEEIVLLLDERDIDNLLDVPMGGVLIVADNPVDLMRRYTLSSVDPFFQLFGTNRELGQDLPVFYISEDIANRLLQGAGVNVNQLRARTINLDQDEIYELPTGVHSSMAVSGDIREKVKVRNVLGTIPGMAGHPGAQLDDKLIVVLAQYDNPPPTPDSAAFPGANDNAAGVAVMLEAIRTIQESGYQPYKTLMFIAYSGEGLEGGETVVPDMSKFLQTKYGFSKELEVEAVVQLRGLGAGDGDRLLLSAGGSLRLADLFATAARKMGVPATRSGERVDISVIFEEGSNRDSGAEAPQIGLLWEGWDATARTSLDTLNAIEINNLEDAGQALSLALMILGRETQY